jgi:uncharacterized membrane-anchored protein YitT (DUF2179 family)
MTSSLIVNAILYNLFLFPLDIVTGSATGVGTITHHLYHIDPALMVLFISIACIIISFMYLGIKKTLGTIVASLAYPIFIALASPLNTIIQAKPEDMLIIVIFAGILQGIANGLMYRSGYSNGGFPIISQILEEKYHIPIAKSALVINLTIVFVGGFFFGSINVMYAIIFLYINDIVMNKVLLGVNNNKSFYIITSEEEDIKDYIINDLGHQVTVFNVKGGFMEKRKKAVLTIIPSREYYKVKEMIKLIDKDAFCIVTNSYQAEGVK